MGIISDIKEKRTMSLSQFDNWLDVLISGVKSKTGATVNEQKAMRLSSVFACVRIISEDVASLPLNVYEEREDGGRSKAKKNYLYPLLHKKPNNIMTSFTWREVMMAHLLLWGNHYSQMITDGNGRVTGLWPLHPARVQPVVKNRKLYYEYKKGDNTKKLFKPYEILHIPGLGFDGLQGISVIQYNREAVGLGLGAEEFGARFFENGAHPSGIIEYPEGLKDNARERLKKDLKAKHAGLGKSHNLMVFEHGMKFHQISIPPNDAQFLECTVPGTMVTMSDGTRKPVEKLKVNDEIIGWDNGPTKAKIKAVGKPPLKELVKITTSRGRTLTASYDHPCLVKENFRTPGGRKDKNKPIWKPLGKIKKGEYIKVGLGNVWEKEKYNPELSWMLGALVGDGYIRSGCCMFTNENKEVIKKMKKSLSGLGAELKKKTSSKYDYEILTNGVGCNGSAFRKLMNKSRLVDKGSSNKRVPELIMQGGPKAWSKFLSGYLDTDGSVNGLKNKGQPLAYWSSVNKELLDDCQHLLAMLGINSAIYLASDKCIKNIKGHEVVSQKQWGLYVTGYSELKKLAKALKPVHATKKQRLNGFNILGDSRYRSINWEYDRIKKVEKLGKGETIGVEVEGCHTHITNGLITHNTRQFQVREIARIYRVPPHMLADMEKGASFKSIEQQSIDYVVKTLRPWLVRIEQVLNDKLISSRNSKNYIEFNVEGLLRGDSQARSEYYKNMFEVGAMSPNDILEKENRNPVEGGDQRFVPLNFIPLNESNPRLGEEENNGRMRTKRHEIRARRSAAKRTNIRERYKRLIKKSVEKIVDSETSAIRKLIDNELRSESRSAQDFRDKIVSFYEDFAGEVRKEMEPVLRSLADAIAEEAAEEINLEEYSIDDFFEDYIEAMSGGYAGYSRGQLLALMNEAEEDEEAAELIEKRLEEWEEKRADKQAKEQSTKVEGAIFRHVATAGGVTEFIWVAGAEACPICRQMDGKVVGVQENFLDVDETIDEKGGYSASGPKAHAPLHEACNCTISAN